MKNLEALKDRFGKEPFNKRLGHLACDLLRISNSLGNPKNIRFINDVLEESKFFIEWTAPGAPFDVQSFLSEIQLKLSLWQLQLQEEKERFKDIKEIKRITRMWSDRLIEMSGIMSRSRIT